MLRGCLLAWWDCNPPLWAQNAGQASLERAIAKLNDELELLRAQSELAISRKT